MSIEQVAPGVWDIESTENFDEYMKALGVGMATRMIGNKVKPTQTIGFENGEWTIKTTSTFKSGEVKFKIGEPFEETTPDGRKVETTFTVDGMKLIQVQKGEPTTTQTRDFKQDSFVMTLEVKNVVAKRVYKRTQ